MSKLITSIREVRVWRVRGNLLDMAATLEFDHNELHKRLIGEDYSPQVAYHILGSAIYTFNLRPHDSW